MGNIRVCADAECTREIDKIGWDSKVIVTLFSGEKITLENTALSGRVATATAYIKNTYHVKFYVKAVSCLDERLKLITKSVLHPNETARLTIMYEVPDKPTSKDVIEPTEIKIFGYYNKIE